MLLPFANMQRIALRSAEVWLIYHLWEKAVVCCQSLYSLEYRMYRLLQDFQRDWVTEAEMTQKMIAALTNESLGQSVVSDGRSLGFIAWHIVQTIPEMMGRAGVSISFPGDNTQPSNAMDIAAAYDHLSRALIDSVMSEWNDDMLIEETEMYGDRWARGQTLQYLILHQAHHRGQMTVLMRQAGLTVPGTYGPAREEWSMMGMPPMA